MNDDPVASNTNWLAIVIQTRCVDCEVETELLHAYITHNKIYFVLRAVSGGSIVPVK